MQALCVVAGCVGMAHLHFDVSRQQQCIGIGLAQGFKTLHEGARVKKIVLQVEDLGQIEQGQRVVRIGFNRLAEITLRQFQLAIAVFHQTAAGICKQHVGRLVERIFHGPRKIFLRLDILTAGAKELAVIVVGGT